MLPQGLPGASVIVGLYFAAGLLLILLPFVVWLALRFICKFSFYDNIRSYFQSLQQRWPALYIVGTLLISAFMLAIFMILAWETMFQHTMAAFDNTAYWLVRFYASPTVDRVMIFITDLGYGLNLLTLIIITVVILGHLKRWREATGLVVCMSGAAYLNYLLKHLFERSRPDLARIVEAYGYSFPSGHAMVSLCFYGLLTFLTIRNIHNPLGRAAVLSGACLVIAAVGVSRIYLGAHYASDVIAGFAAGSMWLAFCISLVLYWESKSKL